MSESNSIEASGTWEYAEGEAVISWTDEWIAILRQTPDGVKKLAYRTTDFSALRPFDVVKAERA